MRINPKQSEKSVQSRLMKIALKFSSLQSEIIQTRVDLNRIFNLNQFETILKKIRFRSDSFGMKSRIESD